MRRHASGRLIAAAALAVFWSSSASSYVQVPQFRAGVTLVPVEVRVVDKDGYPVRDLTKADFTVREDGLAQEIAHFQAVSLDGSPEWATGRRTFVIVLGRGQLNAPTKALQALIDFVRSKTLPADRVGVMAYLRAIELTTNHEAVARFLEAYRDRHEAIEDRLTRDGRRSRPPRTVAPDTRASIDALFGPDTLDVRDLPGGAGNAVSRYNDSHYLNAALEYLGAIAGDKHVIVVSEKPFGTGRPADKPLENYWFRLAMGARTALSFIHAGGLTGPTLHRGGLSLSTGTSRMGSLLGNLEPWNIAEQRSVADQTGGTSSFFQFADKPLTALDRATRFHYLLGYYPSREVAPEKSRNVQVFVTRPGVTLLYRHGYQAKPGADAPKDYRRAVTEARIDEAALRLLNPVLTDGPMGRRPMGATWDMRLTALGPSTWAASGSVRMAVAFDPTWVMFTKEGATYAAELDVGLLADDAKRNVVGESTQRLTFTLTEAEYERSQRKVKPQSLTFEVTINVKARPAYVRAVLFQFDTDRITSAQVRLRK